MPIVDACIVTPANEDGSPGTAKLLANAIADALGVASGEVWVRVNYLPQTLYAENSSEGAPCPVFLKVLHADVKPIEHVEQEAKALAQVVGACLERSPELVHIEFAPAGRGRIAFGGRLLR